MPEIPATLHEENGNLPHPPPGACRSGGWWVLASEQDEAMEDQSTLACYLSSLVEGGMGTREEILLAFTLHMQSSCPSHDSQSCSYELGSWQISPCGSCGCFLYPLPTLV